MRSARASEVTVLDHPLSAWIPSPLSFLLLSFTTQTPCTFCPSFLLLLRAMESSSAEEKLDSDRDSSFEPYALSEGNASPSPETKLSEAHASSEVESESQTSPGPGAPVSELSSSEEVYFQALSHQRHYEIPLPQLRLTKRFSTQFISSRGNEYFCEIDEEYLTDRFNLTGLNAEVPYYQYALDLITDVFDLDADDELREQIEKSARHLYGLIHARYIVTTRGLAKMVSRTKKYSSSFPILTYPQVEKYKKGDFGKCPRVYCDAHPLLPMGPSDVAHVDTVKLYCPKCEDTYNPKSSRHSSIDGAYFGTSFHNILFQVYPTLVPEKSLRRYEPRVFGFRIHAAAALARWQDRFREEMQERLKSAGLEAKFAEESEGEDDEFETDEEDDGIPAKQPEARAEVAGEGPSTRMDLGN